MNALIGCSLHARDLKWISLCRLTSCTGDLDIYMYAYGLPPRPFVGVVILKLDDALERKLRESFSSLQSPSWVAAETKDCRGAYATFWIYENRDSWERL